MSYRHTLEAAVESLHEIEELLGDFSRDEKIPAMDMDLALQKLRSLYDLLLMIRKQQETPQKKVISSSPDTPPVEPVVQPIIQPIVQPAAPAPAPPVATPVVTPAPGRVTPSEAEQPVPPAETVPPVAAHARTVSHKERAAKDVVQTLSDQFKGKPTIHEILNHPYAKEEETLAHARPISDLLEAIGINDRFTFVGELFHGDTAAFENTINQLNESANFNDAYNYMIQHFNWDMDSQAVQILLNIIRRKFIKGRHE
jgi:hypothetical protein